MSQQSTTATLLRIFPYAKSAIPRTVWGTVAALGSYGAALYMPQVLSRLINSLQSHGTVAMVWGLALSTLGIGVVEVGLLFLRRWLVLAPGTHVEANLRRSLYAKLQDLPVSFHDRWPSGQLLSRATGDLSLIRRWLSFGLVMLTANAFVIVIGLGVLFSINWILGTIFLVFSIPIWFKGFRFESQYHTMARLSQDQSGDLATSVEQAIHGVRVLKAFGRGEFMASKFAADSDELRQTEVKKAKLIAGIWIYLILVPEFAAGFALLAGVYLMATHQITVGSLVAFFATATVMRWPTESIGFMLSMTLDAKTAVERFFEVLDAPVEITDPEVVQAIENPQGRLEFRDVRFRFADVPVGGEELIKGVDLVIEPGESVALIGVTGCGKSTLTALITRLYDVTGGQILLDGVDIRNLTREDLRSNIAMAFEDATLFSASVRENVLLGDANATEADLTQALEIAQAGFAYDLPQGLDTKIGEEGMSLSGGQRQRLALARAVAAKPKVLVLDDPLSALDVDTEALVEEALRTVLATTSALIVAHRPSTVQLADKVALLEDGRITAFGTHRELLETSAHYRFVISSLDDEAKDIDGRESLEVSE
ncbi:MAG: ABC transporter ATP-binding protein [Micrococcales bacterium]